METKRNGKSNAEVAEAQKNRKKAARNELPRQIAEALEIAHEKGVIHRDLKRRTRQFCDLSRRGRRVSAKIDRMCGRSYIMRNYSAALSVLLAALIAFAPPGLLPRLAASNPLDASPILAVALPSTSAVSAAPRVHLTGASGARQQNFQYQIASGLATSGAEAYAHTSEPEVIHRFQSHRSFSDCDRAPPLATTTN